MTMKNEEQVTSESSSIIHQTIAPQKPWRFFASAWIQGVVGVASLLLGFGGVWVVAYGTGYATSQFANDPTELPIYLTIEFAEAHATARTLGLITVTPVATSTEISGSVQPTEIPELAESPVLTIFNDLTNFESITTVVLTIIITIISVFSSFGTLIRSIIRERITQLDKQKAALIIKMSSEDNITALNAVKQLHAYDWLHDGSLEGANLREANLSDAFLVNANLKDGNLRKAILSGASLLYANLSDVSLVNANLAGVSLYKTNLTGAQMQGANMKHANIYGIKCDKNTTLPDGTKWTPDIDWTKFGAVELDLNEWKAYRREHGLDKD